MRMAEWHPIDKMERIDHEEASKRIDEILEKVNDGQGIIITRDGKDDFVICPYGWFEPDTKEEAAAWPKREGEEEEKESSGESV